MPAGLRFAEGAGAETGAGGGGVAGDAFLARGAIERNLWIQTVYQSGERDRFAHMMQAADPCDQALKPVAESGMRNRSVFAQIEVPRECGLGQVVLANTCKQCIIIVLALGPANHLSVALGGQQIIVERT